MFYGSVINSVLIKLSTSFKLSHTGHTKTYPMIVDFAKVKLNLITIYRPPKSPNFFDQFQSLLSDLISIKSSFIITGDLNIHLDVADNPDTLKFNQILDDFNLIQNVTTPTHTHGHLLDVFITQEDFPSLVDVTVSDSVSDHLIITATLNFDKPNSKHNISNYL